MHKGKCILHTTNKNKGKVLLGTIVGGILIIASAMIAAIAVYYNKFRRKEQGVADKRSGQEMESRSFLYQG